MLRRSMMDGLAWIQSYERFCERKDWLDELIAPCLFEDAQPSETGLKMLFEELALVENTLRSVD
jgi:hypothetical protein